MSAVGVVVGCGLLTAVALAFAVLGAWERWTR